MADLQSAALATWLRRPVILPDWHSLPRRERWNRTGEQVLGQGVPPWWKTQAAGGTMLGSRLYSSIIGGSIIGGGKNRRR
jgi:hypothetical protein